MPNPQLTAGKQLRQFLTTEGVPRVVLLALLERIDQKRNAAGNGADFEVNTASDPSPAHQVRVAFYSPDEATTTALGQLAQRGQVTCSAPPRALSVETDRPADIASFCRPGDVLLLRHPESGAAHAVAAALPPTVQLINGMDGRHAEPLGALHDLMILRQRLPVLHNGIVLLKGNLVQNGRMRALIHALTTLGVPEVRVLHDADEIPVGTAALGVQAFSKHELEAACIGVDAMLSYVTPQEGAQMRVILHGAAPDQAAGEAAALRLPACILSALLDTLRDAA